MTESVYYGLQKLGAADAASLNDYAFSWFNVDALDRLLYKINLSIFDQEHPIESPTISPLLSVSPSGGIIPAGRTARYRYSFVDIYGNETAASPESVITTPAPIISPNPPAIITTAATGTLTYGTYFYALSAYVGSDSNETTAGSPSYIASTETSHAVTLTLPTLPAGASGFVVYKKGPGQSVYYYLATVDVLTAATPPTEYIDDGSVSQNISRTPSIINTTNSSNGIVITLPTGAAPVGYTWKIYRTYVSGQYESSLLRWVTEELPAATPTGAVNPAYLDIGLAPTMGSPQARNLIFGALRTDLADRSQLISSYEYPVTPPWTLTQTGATVAVPDEINSLYRFEGAPGTGLEQQAYVTNTVALDFDKVYSIGFKYTPADGPLSSGQMVQIMEVGSNQFKLRLFLYSDTLDGTVRYRATIWVDGEERNLSMPLAAAPYVNSLQFLKTPILNNVGAIDTIPQYVHCILDLDTNSRFVTKPAIQIFVNGILTLYGDLDTASALMAATPAIVNTDLTYLSVGLLGYIGPTGTLYTQTSDFTMVLDYIYVEQSPVYGSEFNEINATLFGHTHTYKAHRQYEAVTRQYLAIPSTRTTTVLEADTGLAFFPISNQSPFVEFQGLLKYAAEIAEGIKIQITLGYDVITPWTASEVQYTLVPHDNVTSGAAGKIYSETDTVYLTGAGASTYNMVQIQGFVYNSASATPFPASNLGTMYLIVNWAKGAEAFGTATLAPGSFFKVIDQ